MDSERTSCGSLTGFGAARWTAPVGFVPTWRKFWRGGGGAVASPKPCGCCCSWDAESATAAAALVLWERGRGAVMTRARVSGGRPGYILDHSLFIRL